MRVDSNAAKFFEPATTTAGYVYSFHLLQLFNVSRFMAPESEGTRCTGCKQLFPNGRSYGNHKRACKLQKAAAAARLNDRRQNLNRRQEAAEEARRMREQEDLDHEEVVMEVEDVEMHDEEV